MKLLGLLALAALAAGEPPVTAVVVRHAERAASPPDDPPLTEAGRARARLLAQMLRETRIAAVYVTRFRRTQETAQPAAGRFHLTLLVRDSVAELRDSVLAQTGKTVLVVGHSDTVPQLIAALGGPAGITIQSSEFDRLCILHVGSEGAATLVPLRYGTPSPQGEAAAASRLIRFRRSGGIAGREVAGSIEIASEGARVTAPSGYSRPLPAAEVRALVDSIAASRGEEEPIRGADRYQYEIFPQETGPPLVFSESGRGALAEWVRKETAAIERARARRP